MEPKLIWLSGFAATLVVVVVLSVLFGLRSRSGVGAGAPSNANAWLGAIVTLVPVSVLLGVPALTYQYGLAAAHLALFPVVVAFLMPAVIRAQSPIGSDAGTFQPDNIMRITAIIFAVLFVAVELRLAGFAIETLTDNFVSSQLAIISLAALLLIQVLFSGLRALSVMELLFLVAITVSIVAFGVLQLEQTGGFGELAKVLEQLQAAPATAEHPDFRKLFGFSSELGSQFNWSPVTVATTLFACAGLAMTPAVLQWVHRDGPLFSGVGFAVACGAASIVLVLFGALLALIGYALGSNVELTDAAPDIVNPVMSYLLDERAASDLSETPGGSGSLLPFLYNLFSDSAPWLVACVSLMLAAACHLAASASLIAARGYMQLGSGWGAAVTTLAVVCLLVCLAAWLAINKLPFDAQTFMALSTLLIGLPLQLLPRVLLRTTVPHVHTATSIGFAIGCCALLVFSPELPGIFGMSSIWKAWVLGIHPAVWALAINIAVTALCWGVFGKTYEHSWGDFGQAFVPLVSVVIWLLVTVLMGTLTASSNVFGVPGLLVTLILSGVIGTVLAATLARSEH